jgi:hypothetical protein
MEIAITGIAVLDQVRVISNVKIVLYRMLTVPTVMLRHGYSPELIAPVHITVLKTQIKLMPVIVPVPVPVRVSSVPVPAGKN